MGILSYFGKQTYTLYIGYHSGYFEDVEDSEIGFRLDYKFMKMHQNSHKGWGVDYDDLPRLIDPPIRTVIKTSSDLLGLIQMADQFNKEQAKDLYYRVSQKIDKGNINLESSDCPFPIKFNYQCYDSDYLEYLEGFDEYEWDDWYS